VRAAAILARNFENNFSTALRWPAKKIFYRARRQ